jgi:PiT family inorganic phosphate transporter
VYIQTGQLSVFQAALLGGASIALGAITYSRNVMMTVGKKLVKMDPFSAAVAVLSMAVVVHLYAKVGVPVSTSQGIIGAVLGIGFLKGVQTINIRTLLSIVFGWIGTPLVAMVISYTAFVLLRSIV